MALVSKNIPNLINGVSQQPAALRLESQGEVQENGFSDVVEGLKKRPPTKFIRKLEKVKSNWSSGEDLSSFQRENLTESEVSGAFFHTYKRSDDEQYLVVITTDKKVRVYDVLGKLRYESGKASWLANGTHLENNSDDTSYLSTTTTKTTATSVADATFIVNTDKTVTEGTNVGVVSQDLRTALVYLKSVNYGRTYTVKLTVNGSSNYAASSYTTPKQITDVDSNNDQTINSDELKVQNVIRKSSAISTVTEGNITYTLPNGNRGLRAVEDATNISVLPAAYGKEPYFIVKAEAAFGDFDIKVTDDDGGVNLKAFKGSAKSFSDLPNQCEDGYVLGVVGDNQKKEDDFYVKFEGTGGSGYWKECTAPNINNGLDVATMPHQLKQKANLSFTFSQGPWDNRLCGDNDTNPFPSFVGQKITDIFFHRNRLGVLAGENVIFSEASGYYNFFRTTVRTLLDSDPIDVTVSQNEVSDLKAAVPVQDNLLLFSNLNQFTLSATQLLTPSEVTIDQSTKYECDLTASPIGAGNSVFFATKSGDYAGVREYFTRETTEIRDAVDVTSHVPEYLLGNIRQFAASSNEDMLIALTSTNNKECYVYKWYNSSTERLQSSWSKWTFSKGIASVSFTNADLYFVFTDGSYETMSLTKSSATFTHIETNDASYVEVGSEKDVLLDHRTELDPDPSEGDGPITLSTFNSYNLTANTQFVNHKGIVIATGNTDAEKNKVIAYINNAANSSIDTHTEIINGVTLPIPNYVYIGEPYTFKYQLSEQVFRPVKGDTTTLARLQLRKIAFNFNETGHFEVDVASTGRAASKTVFTGRTLGQIDNLLGYSAVVQDGSQEVGVQSQANQTNITITNDTHLPCIFQSAEWEGFVTLRNQRL